LGRQGQLEGTGHSKDLDRFLRRSGSRKGRDGPGKQPVRPLMIPAADHDREAKTACGKVLALQFRFQYRLLNEWPRSKPFKV
jgi:hypothetical protein